jgi:excisionase family DNA binding protein
VKYLSTREVCKTLSITPTTLRAWADAGRIDYIRTPTNQRKYNLDSLKLEPLVVKRKICYCRVSSRKQTDDLQRQAEYLTTKFPNHELITDIGSGLNFKRKGLQTLLESICKGEIGQLVVAHKDRLSRFGFELIRWLVEFYDGELLVLDRSEGSAEQELTRDLLSILHVFSCRLHGLRKYGSQIKKDKSLSECRATTDL